MKKAIDYIIVVMAVLLLGGCGAAIQYGLGAVQIAAPFIQGDKDKAAVPTVSSTPKPNLVMGQELARHQINQFEILVNNGFYKGESCVTFAVYENNEVVKAIAYRKNNGQEMQRIKYYMERSSEIEKKQLIRMMFLSKYNFDLGPVEPVETAEKPSNPSFSRDVPTTGFAPKF